jgi:type IV secretion system protein VirB10
MSDAIIPTPAPESTSIEGERHVSEVAGRNSGLGKKAGIGIIVAGGFLAVGAILLTSQKPDLKTNPPQIRPQISYEAPTLPVQSVATPPLPDQPAPKLPTQPVGFATGTAAASKPLARLLVFNTGGSSRLSSSNAGTTQAAYPAGQGGTPGGYSVGGPGGVPGGFDGQGGQHGESLGARLQPMPLSGVSANVLRNQPYLLTTGTLMPCVLQTAMDSTLPGFVTCVIPQDVLGKTGIVLLDRGTRVVGQFQGGVRQGVERMFVLWTRAETPQGVVINLDSPATDPLGRSGMDGEVDSHFWKRFGGALLLSTVEGALSTGQAAVSKAGTVTVNTSNTSGVIEESLRGSVNLPPTIRKNQGELVSIFVARDLDFSTVYQVAPTPLRYPAGGSSP